MTKPVAFKPRLTVFPARSNAQFMLGDHQGRFVIAKMAIPDIHGTQDEAFEVVFESDTYAEAIERIKMILNPTRYVLVAT